MDDAGVEVEVPPQLFGYRWLGRLDNGLHVLETWYNGGGSRTFYDLVLLRVRSVRRFDRYAQRRRLLLETEHDFGLGDRTESRIRLEGNRILLDMELWLADGERQAVLAFDESGGLADAPPDWPKLILYDED